MDSSDRPRTAHRRPDPTVFVGLALTVLVAVIYFQTLGHDFVNIDDLSYVVHNDHVRAGLTGDSIRWAFASYDGAIWQPLIWLSFMADVELYGLNPAGYHLTNLVLHLINGLLLFGWLRAMTGCPWKSGVVALLFAVHPLHVESVAWVTERKDVLSTLFWMLCLCAYARYAMRPGAARFMVVFGLFGCGLMAKPMLVTLPVVLLLLDYWPLARVQTVGPVFQRRLLLEKLPFAAVAALFSFIAVASQSAGKGTVSLAELPLGSRMANAVVSYAGYLVKMAWPFDLAVYYPHPGTHPVWRVLVCGAFLLAVCLLALRFRKRWPWVTVGWFWYLVTLLPVIGIVQIGAQAMADRYTYVTMIGIYILVVWSIDRSMAGWRSRGWAAAALVLVLSVVAWKQAGYWQNSITLFQRAVAVTTDNHLAHTNLGLALAQQGRIGEACPHLTEALRLRPDMARAYHNLATCHLFQGNLTAAVWAYEQALQRRPGFVKARRNLAMALLRLGRRDEAVRHLEELLRMMPGDVKTAQLLNRAMAIESKPNE